MKSEFKLEMECGVCGVQLMFLSLKAICEYINLSSKVQEVHHYR